MWIIYACLWSFFFHKCLLWLLPGWTGFLFFFVGLLFFYLSLHLGLGALRRDFKTSTMKGKMMAIGGVCISSGILLLTLLFGFGNLDKYGDKEKIHVLYCSRNLKQIGIALNQYASDNDGFFPDGRGAEGFEKLWKGKYVTDPKLFVCPADYETNKVVLAILEIPLTEKNVSYMYLGSGVNKKKDWPYTIIVRDKLGNHRNTNNILHLDGQVDPTGTGTRTYFSTK